MNEKKFDYSGIPMTEEGVKDWQKSFTDITESIEELYKDERRNKENNRMDKGYFKSV